MAICHFRVKTIRRATGSRAVAAAAYRSGSRLYDEGLARTYDFSKKPNVVHSEILTPSAAACAAWPDQNQLWNSVEAFEKRKDAQLAREVVVAIPRELDGAQGIALVRSFVQKTFVDKGMIADLNVHWDMASDGKPNPHAHVMLTMRGVAETSEAIGFGPKIRAWNKLPLLMEWRQAWAEQINECLARENLGAWVDHRRNRRRGIVLTPQRHLSLAAFGIERRGRPSAEMMAYRDTARRNGEVLIVNPAVGLSAMTHQRATFSSEDLMRFAQYHSDSRTQFDQVLSALSRSPALVALGRDKRGVERYTSLEMLHIEQDLDRAAHTMARSDSHPVANNFVAVAIADSWRNGLPLSAEQLSAVKFLTRSHQLSVLVGYAGAGKSATLSVAHQAWAAQGYKVQGAALSGIAAQNIQDGATIPSRTLASLEYAWSQGKDLIGPQDILVIDEAGLVGSRQLQTVLDQVQKAGAKIVLVGDVEQLQAIEAGAAFRLIAQRHGSSEITEVRRQLQPWQAAATRALGDGKTGSALAAYFDAGLIHAHNDGVRAQQALIDDWAADRSTHPSQSQLIMGYSREEVRSLNILARHCLKGEGRLGNDHHLHVSNGDHVFAVNDRVFFRRNMRELDVKNGTAGTITSIEGVILTVQLDHGRDIKVDLRSYSDLEYGYATTIHRAQGVTVDRAYLLAGRGMDRHAAYVGLSRHRQSVIVHYDRNDYSSREELVRALSRDRSKDMALDYIESFAALRDLARPRTLHQNLGQIPSGWRASARSGIGHADLHAVELLERYVALAIEIQRTRRNGSTLTSSQTRYFAKVIKQVSGLWPGAERDLRAVAQNSRFVGWVARGRTDLAMRALLAHRDNRRDLPVKGRGWAEERSH